MEHFLSKTHKNRRYFFTESVALEFAHFFNQGSVSQMTALSHLVIDIEERLIVKFRL